MAERSGETKRRPLGRRLIWFVGLWLAGVAALAAVAGLLKLALQP